MLRIVILISFFAIGCGNLTTDGIDHGRASPKPKADTIFTNIADAIDAGLIDNSTQLELILSHLHEMGKVNDDQINAAYAALPGIDQRERAISKADADLLRGI